MWNIEMGRQSLLLNGYIIYLFSESKMFRSVGAPEYTAHAVAECVVVANGHRRAGLIVHVVCVVRVAPPKAAVPPAFLPDSGYVRYGARVA
jgi:hypothetical protein